MSQDEPLVTPLISVVKFNGAASPDVFVPVSIRGEPTLSVKSSDPAVTLVNPAWVESAVVLTAMLSRAAEVPVLSLAAQVVRVV
jgi:hypothetical protein